VFSLVEPPSDVAAQRVAQGSRKILVDSADTDAAAELARQGGVLLVEYDAFSLWSVPSGSSALAASRTMVTQDDADTIKLHGGRSIGGRWWRHEHGVGLDARRRQLHERQLF
jgi:hypothetical protein